MFPRTLIALMALTGCALPCLAEQVNLAPVIAGAAAKSLGKKVDQLTTKDLTKVTSLELSDRDLKSLDGLDQLSDLRILDASDNNVSDLGPLDSLSKLEYLDLTGNPNLSPEEVKSFQTGHHKCLVLFVADKEKNDEGKISLQLSRGGHSRDITCVAWSPDGKRLAGGSADNTVKVWQLAE